MAMLIGAAFWSLPANAQIQQGLATGVVLDQIQSELDLAITSALQAGDLLIYQAGVEARDVIAAWRQANGDLLDDAFSKLDGKTRELFMKADALVDKVNSGVGDRLSQAQELGDTALTISTQIPTQQRTLITRYSPRVLVPQSSAPKVLTLYGANFAEAKPVLKVADGTEIKPLSLTNQSVSYRLPASFGTVPDGAGGIVPAQISYIRNASAIFKKRVTKDLAFWALPATMGSYTIVPTVERANRVAHMVEIHTGELKGKDKNILKGINPPQGWLFDLARIDGEASLRGNGGEAGRCQLIAPQDRSENGVMVQVRVDHITKWNGKKPGWIRCIATMPVYKLEKVTQSLSPITGAIAWSSDVRIAPPDGIRDWVISVNTMDGRNRQFTGSGFDALFQVTADKSGVLIKPTPPKGF